jgi:tRNA A-37 threonylcarbamoyl transferase component Bud32
MESIGWQTLHSFKENLTTVSSGAATNTTQLSTENQIKVSIRQNVHKAVTLLHENGFVHGDLRPNNILGN